jgi:DNA (cytosine-5)-methyltransferase 1
MQPGLIVDSFAGGGGASTGIEMALGHSPDVAINHDPEALAMHAANHPQTLHLTENVWKVDPHAVTGGKPVFLLWASPDCRHHSKAKGGAPVSRSVRGLADVVLMWAATVRPQIICLENVEEFADWGPLTDDGRPCPDRRGLEFRRWVKGLEREGYAVDWRQLRACDFGAPTIRKRLFLVARRDGKPIVWPARTHGDPKKDADAIAAGTLKPWRTAAEIIDWSLPCPSIFLTREEAKAQGLNVVRPLAAKTLSRIARGFKRYVLDRESPFIVVANHGGDGFRGQGIDAPLATICRSRDAMGLVTPHLMTMRNSGKPYTAADEPAHTVTAGGAGLSLVAGFMAQHNTDMVGHDAREPLSTIVGKGCTQAPVMGYLASLQNNTARGDMGEPVGTVLAGANHHALATPFISYAQQGGHSRPADAPHHTVCANAKDQNQVVMPHLTAYYGSSDEPGSAADEPVRTATGKARFGHVEAVGLPPPLDDVRLSRARQVAAFLRAEGVWDGGDLVTVGPYVVWDIGMRMLTPRELARAQGFPEHYVLAAPLPGGKVLTETAQRHKIGNSVCPDVAAAVVRANAIDAIKLPDVRRRLRAFPQLTAAVDEAAPQLFAAE